MLDRSIPNSGGYFRAITVEADEGTVVNAVFPAACGARGITGFRVMDAVAGALAQAAPDRVPAAGEGGNTIISLGGDDRAGRPFIYVDMFSGARGAGKGYDGPAGVPHPGSNNANMPIEIAESTYPLRFLRYGIVEDSASPGQWRGSPALVREFDYLGSDTPVQVRSDKRAHPPFGLAGGAPGRPSMTTVDHAGEVTERPVIGPSDLLTGDRFRHELASGGGWGDPLDRDPAAVLHDVRNGLIGVARARGRLRRRHRRRRDRGSRRDRRRARPSTRRPSRRAHPATARGLAPGAELAAHDLAGRGQRQGVEVLDRARVLVGAEPLADEPLELGRQRLVAGCARHEDHERLDRLRPDRVGDADDRGHGDRRVAQQAVLDLARADPVARRW